MYYRNIETMVHKAAPFLKYDSDPYAVILNSQVYWVMDAYTTTDNYPYSQNANTTGMPAGSGLNTSFNYVRNSVKVVINAYAGKMYFFVVDTTTRSSRCTRRRFPTCSSPQAKANTLIPGITAHFRYPEDFFRVQTDHVRALPPDRSSRLLLRARGLVGVARSRQRAAVVEQLVSGADPGRQRAAVAAAGGPPGPSVHPGPPSRVDPAELHDHHPLCAGRRGDGTPEPDRLDDRVVGLSEPNQPYGTLTVYETPTDETVDGPGLISSIIHSNPRPSRRS